MSADEPLGLLHSFKSVDVPLDSAFAPVSAARAHGIVAGRAKWRRIELVVLGSDLWRIDIGTQLPAVGGAVTLVQTSFGLLGVRMAKRIGVADGGGRILNSEGGVNEVGCVRKAARWVDYSGTVTADVDEGITLLDHPQNLHHPVEFHVRNDDWMGGCNNVPCAHHADAGEASPSQVRVARAFTAYRGDGGGAGMAALCTRTAAPLAYDGKVEFASPETA